RPLRHEVARPDHEPGPSSKFRANQENQMKKFIAQVAAILLVSLGAAGVHGAINGFKMQPKAANTLPIRTAQVEQTADPVETEDPAQAAVGEKHADDLGMTAEELHEYWAAGEVVLVDARPPDQFAESRIPGAFSVPFEAFFDGAPEFVYMFPPETMVVI